MNETVIANLAFILFWLVVVVLIFSAGQRWPRVRPFRAKIAAQWRPALAITLLALANKGLTGSGLVNPYAVALFCQSLLGLAVARSIANYEPLLLMQAFIDANEAGALWA